MVYVGLTVRQTQRPLLKVRVGARAGLGNIRQSRCMGMVLKCQCGGAYASALPDAMKFRRVRVYKSKWFNKCYCRP
jgi:hypothetical protein